MKKILSIIALISIVSCSNKENKGSTDKTKVVQEMIPVSTETNDDEENEYWNKILQEKLYSALSDPLDSIYISDRTQLEKIGGENCQNDILTFIYTSGGNDNIEIIIQKGSFDPAKHQINIVDTVYKIIDGEKLIDGIKTVNIIDGKYSYGIDGNIPTNEIKSLSIKWNGEQLVIPNTIYSNLYEPNFCRNYSTVEAYITQNNNLYLYMACSDGAGGYSVKFIFDNQKYLTRIITTNEMTNGFDFLDGTAKVD